MKLQISKIMATLALVCAVSCQSPAPQKLDIGEFLSLTQGDAIAPTPAQVAMIEPFVPNDTYSPFPTIENREFWDGVAATELGQATLAEAQSLVSKKPEVPISDEIYRRANLEGNRAIYKPRYYRTMDRLEKFLLAECIENQGNFITPIEEYSYAIIQMKSWVHPNHDDKDNGILEGRRVAVDLGARKFGLLLSLVDITLEDRLDSGLRADIQQNVARRVSDTYLASCRGEGDPKNNSWIRATSNWNSVCTSGSLFTVLTMSKDKAARVEAIGSVINSMKYYLSGFGSDGYCSEGLGYWNYGFGHYLYIAEIIYDYTDGKIDLFTFDNPEKMVAVANYPARYEMHNGRYAPFADGSFKIAPDNDNFAYLMSAKHYGSRKPTYFKPDEAVFAVIGWRDAAANVDPDGVKEVEPVTLFDDMGVVISRGTQEKKLSVAIKAGNNGENHNHDDVGSYVVLLEDEIMSGDIGSPSYVAGAFSKNNPARNSWGHPVPRINNTIQSNGKEFYGKIISTEFVDGQDMAKLNILPAYEVPALTKLERTMIYKKADRGHVTIIDEFEASEPVTFGTTIMVGPDFKISGNTVLIERGGHKMKAVVTCEGGEVKLVAEKVPVERLNIVKGAHRIGVDFVKPLDKGSITVEYMPL